MIDFEKNKITTMLKRWSEEDIPFFSVALFAGTWLCIGNFWSIVSIYTFVSISTATTILSVIIYLAVALPVVIFFFVELLRLKTKLKWIILAEVLTFMIFIIPPPRNADAMRVWLAKVYDVFMQGRKLVRPYWHYNTPDAFTLFHLPMINMWDGQIFQFSIWTALCAVLILLIKISKEYVSNDRTVVIILCLFIFNPLIILASTVVITDIPMILAVAGMVYSLILYEQGKFNKSLFFLFLFVVFGMNVKYNMLMFLPPILFWAVKKMWTDSINLKSLPFLFILTILAILPYYMNYLSIGNPVWPALTKIFPAKNPYWDIVALRTTESFLGGERNIQNFVESFIRLFLIPHHINPMAFIPIFFIFYRFKYLNYMPVLIASSYLFILWLMMPQFAVDEKERYVLYLLPIVLPFGIANIYEKFTKYKYGEKLKQFFEVVVIMTFFLYFTFTFVYSYDAFKYLLTYDKKVWHRATWYYEDYDWINKNIELKDSEKILVIVANQQTYYLKKPYVNGDALSALIDWSAMTDINKIINVIKGYRIKYIYIDNDYLKDYKDAKYAVEILIKHNKIVEIRRSNVRLYSSRLTNKFSETQTILYKVE
ncbi:hypothetical protein JZK55_12190 [Dissulfurispira thermophila]|uniref:Glycosyltransferase RgtA/B/C/D-like domain-containing protein n=1 Tax=Dissulfurispira thermophila TaxID=2715679 RepID=A0A7G1H3J6_9BACT|nr:glycosyltransferase family 39 protein [Dissulfurispira thermophila]BCB96297.1 hypothetical protein JZK55_12190 [Dissulfurispira thermophila]